MNRECISIPDPDRCQNVPWEMEDSFKNSVLASFIFHSYGQAEGWESGRRGGVDKLSAPHHHHHHEAKLVALVAMRISKMFSSWRE